MGRFLQNLLGLPIESPWNGAYPKRVTKSASFSVHFQNTDLIIDAKTEALSLSMLIFQSSTLNSRIPWIILISDINPVKPHICLPAILKGGPSKDRISVIELSDLTCVVSRNIVTLQVWTTWCFIQKVPTQILARPGIFPKAMVS